MYRFHNSIHFINLDLLGYGYKYIMMSMPSNIEHYKNLSKDVLTHQDKIKFFDQNQKAFYLDIYSDSWSMMMQAYAKEENLSSEQLNEIEEMKWKEMPEMLKLFAYDFCILNGFIFTGVGK